MHHADVGVLEICNGPYLALETLADIIANNFDCDRAAQPGIGRDTPRPSPRHQPKRAPCTARGFRLERVTCGGVRFLLNVLPGGRIAVKSAPVPATHHYFKPTGGRGWARRARLAHNRL